MAIAEKSREPSTAFSHSPRSMARPHSPLSALTVGAPSGVTAVSPIPATARASVTMVSGRNPSTVVTTCAVIRQPACASVGTYVHTPSVPGMGVPSHSHVTSVLSSSPGSRFQTGWVSVRTSPTIGVPVSVGGWSGDGSGSSGRGRSGRSGGHGRPGRGTHGRSMIPFGLAVSAAAGVARVVESPAVTSAVVTNAPRARPNLCMTGVLPMRPLPSRTGLVDGM